MSYARFGWDDPAVYIYLSVGGWIECCMCFLDDHQDEGSFHAEDTQTMIDHLKKHEMSGHTVPQDVYERLWEDHEENMQFIMEKKHEQK